MILLKQTIEIKVIVNGKIYMLMIVTEKMVIICLI